jgi:type IV secretion system protein VirB8
MNIKSTVKAFFGKKDNDATLGRPNWEEERYDSITTQRNLALALVFLAIACIAAMAFVMMNIVASKTIDPFVVQIDQSTGSANIVNPITANSLSGYDSLSRYFVKKYISARETYNPADFETLARRYIKLTSQDNIYNQYIAYISDKANDPRILYGTNNTTYMKVKSWSQLDTNKYVCRFSVHKVGSDGKVLNKIAIVDFVYSDAQDFSADDRDLNPVGFKVTSYRVDDDNS